VLLGVIAMLLASTDAPPALEPTAAAEAALRARLTERYPTVTRWDIKAFTKQMPQTTDEVKVVQLGSRSAVQIGRRVYWYSVAGFGPAVSATHTVAPGQAINAGDVQLAEANILAANCDPVSDPAQLGAKRAKKTLRADEIVCAKSVEPLPLVARGDAQHDAGVGDTLLVLNPHSHDLFRAVVSGAREVTIHE
jgi:flagella basal body P-ring formation protein FlgA